jgi:hypothetical protein
MWGTPYSPVSVFSSLGASPSRIAKYTAMAAAETTLTRRWRLHSRPGSARRRPPTLVPARPQRHSCHSTASGSIGASASIAERESAARKIAASANASCLADGRVTASHTLYSDHAYAG